MKDLQAVPLGRIVAGGEDQTIGGSQYGRRIGDQRRGGSFGQENDWNIVAREDLGGRVGRPFGKKAAVESDDHPALFPALASDFVGQRLAEPADVVHGEAFADNGPPAAGAKRHQVLFLVPAGPVKALL